MSDCLSMLDKLNNNGLSYLTRFHNEFLDNTQRSQLCDLYERVPNSKISKCNWVSAAILDLCTLLNGMQNNSNRIYVFHSLAVQNQDKNGMLPLLKRYCVSENSSVLNFIHYFRFSRHFLLFANHRRQSHNTTLFQNDGRAIFRRPKHDNCFMVELF